MFSAHPSAARQVNLSTRTYPTFLHMCTLQASVLGARLFDKKHCW